MGGLISRFTLNNRWGRIGLHEAGLDGCGLGRACALGRGLGDGSFGRAEAGQRGARLGLFLFIRGWLCGRRECRLEARVFGLGRGLRGLVIFPDLRDVASRALE